LRADTNIFQHYDFYYFLVNKSVGPGGERIFNYTSEAPVKDSNTTGSDTQGSSGPLMTSTSRAAAAAAAANIIPDISTLEGADDDPTKTKVVDRRWYERNKHIYPASTWQEFDAEKNYTEEIRRDTGGNAFFYSR
jgi:protein FAM50